MHLETIKIKRKKPTWATKKYNMLLTEYRPFHVDRQLAESTLKENRPLTVKGVIQRAEAKNQNGRIYPKEILEREIIDMLYLWGYVNKKGAWISVEEDFINILKDNKFDFPEKIQGDSKLNNHLEENPELVTFLINHFKEVISK